jgi:hypothetical protein
MFLEIKNGDIWGGNLWNTGWIPEIELTARPSAKLVKKWELHVSVKFCIIQYCYLKWMFLPLKTVMGSDGE